MSKRDLNRKDLIKDIINELRHHDTDTLYEVYMRLKRY